MGIDKYLRQAKDALSGEQGRKFLDKAEDAATKAAGDKHSDKIRKARDAADKALGDDDDKNGTHPPR